MVTVTIFNVHNILARVTSSMVIKFLIERIRKLAISVGCRTVRLSINS